MRRVPTGMAIALITGDPNRTGEGSECSRPSKVSPDLPEPPPNRCALWPFLPSQPPPRPTSNWLIQRHLLPPAGGSFFCGQKKTARKRIGTRPLAVAMLFGKSRAVGVPGLRAADRSGIVPIRFDRVVTGGEGAAKPEHFDEFGAAEIG